MAYKHFTKQEEQQLIDLYKKGFSYNQIAKKLNRSSSSIYLKIKGNKRTGAPSILPIELQKPKKGSRKIETGVYEIKKKPCIVHLGLILELFEFADSPHTPTELKAKADSLGRSIFLLGNR